MMQASARSSVTPEEYLILEQQTARKARRRGEVKATGSVTHPMGRPLRCIPVHSPGR
ncbi:MAG: hypothetical protein HZY76_11610 [Anaerolineae bacterium]|nr:MAG: hypothetical protein HZY76_11610 [Anaerolineae bacterium]